MRITARSHPRGTSVSFTSAASTSLNHASALSYIYAAAASTAAATSRTDQLLQSQVQERSYIALNLQLKEDGLQLEGYRCPRRSYIL